MLSLSSGCLIVYFPLEGDYLLRGAPSEMAGPPPFTRHKTLTTQRRKTKVRAQWAQWYSTLFVCLQLARLLCLQMEWLRNIAQSSETVFVCFCEEIFALVFLVVQSRLVVWCCLVSFCCILTTYDWYSLQPVAVAVAVAIGLDGSVGV